MDPIINIHSADKIDINSLTTQFFKLFDNTDHKIPDWTVARKICIPEIIIIKKTGLTEAIYNLENFIKPRKTILSDGTLTDFQEYELHEETVIIGHIAHRRSRYQKSGNLSGKSFVETGTKLFQFIKTKNGWKISSLVWEDD
ncbi:MAG: DUF4440 domain-containing protein [Bacteroidetes bacterium]|nr:MAG: DUF4440 domain-containing protein [Bacteroidota bacterium]